MRVSRSRVRIVIVVFTDENSFSGINGYFVRSGKNAHFRDFVNYENIRKYNII